MLAEQILWDMSHSTTRLSLLELLCVFGENRGAQPSPQLRLIYRARKGGGWILFVNAIPAVSTFCPVGCTGLLYLPHIFYIQTKPSWLTKCMKRFWSFIQQKYILFKSNWMPAKYYLDSQYWFIKEARPSMPANWIIICFVLIYPGLDTLPTLSKQITGLVSGHDCGIQLISDTHHHPPPLPHHVLSCMLHVKRCLTKQ